MARHLRTTPPLPAEASFSWTGSSRSPYSTSAAHTSGSASTSGSAHASGPASTLTAERLHTATPGPQPRQGRHAATHESPYSGTTTSPAGTPWFEVPLRERTPAPPEPRDEVRGGPVMRLPVRPRPVPGLSRLAGQPVERPDLDILRRVLAALYRL